MTFAVAKTLGEKKLTSTEKWKGKEEKS